jgi:hypothetical protein
MSDSESTSPNRPRPLLSVTGELSAGADVLVIGGGPAGEAPTGLQRDALGAILGETLPLDGSTARERKR